MKKLINRLFGKNQYCTLGELHLSSQDGTPVTVTKKIRYTIDLDGTRVYLNGHEDLVHYCHRFGITYPGGKPL